MSRVVSVRATRVRVADLLGNERETAEKMRQALANDLRQMHRFVRANPMVQLAGPERTWVSAADNMFVAELTNVRNVDAAIASNEAAEFGGFVTCVDGIWTLSVPVRPLDAMPGGTVLVSMLVAAVLFVVAAFVVSPEATWAGCRAAFEAVCSALLWGVRLLKAVANRK